MKQPPSPTGSEPAADTKMLERIRALLAKAESTTFPDEAEALSIKAQELMARFSIDAAMIDHARPSGSVPIQRRITLDNPYVSAKALLLTQVAAANHCQTVWIKNGGYAEVFGFEVDVDAVELLFVSLLVQSSSTMVSAGPQYDRRGRSTTRAFRHAFLTSFGQRVGERLREAARVTTEAAAEVHGRALVPVMAERDEAVRAAMDRAVPLRRPHLTSVSHRGGWDAGRTAADRADLGQRKVTRRR